VSRQPHIATLTTERDLKPLVSHALFYRPMTASSPLAPVAGANYPSEAWAVHPGLDAGVPLRDVQEAASHSDPMTTMRYDNPRKFHQTRDKVRVAWS